MDLARQLNGCERLQLTVHPANYAAINLYKSEGFTDDGVDDDGELCLSVSVS